MYDPASSLLTLLAAGCLWLLAGVVRKGRPELWRAATLLVVVGAAALFLHPPRDLAARIGLASLSVRADARTPGIVGLTLLALLLLAAWRPRSPHADRRSGAQLGLLLLSGAGVIVCGTAVRTVDLWLGLELVSISLAASRTLNGPGRTSSPAASREWMHLLLASLLFGIGTAYSQPMLLADAGLAIGDSPPLPAEFGGGVGDPASVIAPLFIAASLAMRFAAAPFHLGRLAAARAMNWHDLAWWQLLGRAAPLLVWMRLLTFGANASGAMAVATGVIAAASLLAGGLQLYREPHLRERAMGIVLVQNGAALAVLAATGWVTANAGGQPAARPLWPITGGAAWLLWSADAFALAAWMLALEAFGAEDRPLEYADDLRGLGRLSGAAAALATVALMNLVGLPPWPTFWGRWAGLLALWSARREPFPAVAGPPELHPGFVLLGLCVLAGWLILAWNALLLVERMFLLGPLGRPVHSRATLRSWLAWGLIALLLFSGLWPSKGWLSTSPAIPWRLRSPSSPAGGSRQRLSQERPDRERSTVSVGRQPHEFPRRDEACRVLLTRAWSRQCVFRLPLRFRSQSTVGPKRPPAAHSLLSIALIVSGTRRSAAASRKGGPWPAGLPPKKVARGPSLTTCPEHALLANVSERDHRSEKGVTS